MRANNSIAASHLDRAGLRLHNANVAVGRTQRSINAHLAGPLASRIDGTLDAHRRLLARVERDLLDIAARERRVAR